ncbi:hypothetical protein BV898_10942 [Hypsibius exemplaris]|uniref:Uncharacterized protein n=1 Tax=Hypsibius exemplaris TaxID=2072580 RepID=A0A1W0WI72_HYPEX|nr:hypothetical protein BV898_10942 [Hypsibius exemplaris]
MKFNAVAVCVLVTFALAVAVLDVKAQIWPDGAQYNPVIGNMDNDRNRGELLLLSAEMEAETPTLLRQLRGGGAQWPLQLKALGRDETGDDETEKKRYRRKPKIHTWYLGR